MQEIERGRGIDLLDSNRLTIAHKSGLRWMELYKRNKELEKMKSLQAENAHLLT